MTRTGHFVVVCIVIVALLECLWPRRKQGLVRHEFGMDVVYLLLYAYVFGYIVPGGSFNALRSHFGWGLTPIQIFMTSLPAGAQVLISLLVFDLVHWVYHRLAHRIDWLWELHKIHHSPVVLDGVATFRGHWAELVFSGLFRLVPLILLGVGDDILADVFFISVIFEAFAHANLPASLGPFQYLFNGPEMHVWHHDRQNNNRNFGQVFSIWDWCFGTAYAPSPALEPALLGLPPEEAVSSKLSHQLLHPFFSVFVKKDTGQPGRYEQK